MGLTIGDGIAVTAVMLMISIIFGAMVISTDTSDYQQCLRGCPKSFSQSQYENLECPRMCAELKNPSNCVKKEGHATRKTRQ